MTSTTLPPILNEQLMKSALENYHNINKTATSALQVKAFSFKLSAASGDNFCSEIYQVDVQYKLNGNDEQMFFIIKVMIPEIAEIGSNEEIMFTTVLPEMEAHLKASAKENQYENYKLYARCLISERKQEEFYVLENLNTLGYNCADRVKGLDFEHGVVLMQKIAKFHAASMVYAKKFPDVIQSMRGSHFAEGASDFIAQTITFGGLEYVANLIENWPSYESLAQKVKAIIPKFNKLVMEVVNSKNSVFNVVSHGDLWVNNFLYKYNKETNTPTDVVFVDFQNSFWGSCGYDINYVLYTSLELEVLKENRPTLLQTYYDVLRQTLENLKYPEIPSREDVFGEFKRCEIIGFYAALCELPIVSLEKSKAYTFDLNTFKQPEEIKKMRVLMYESPRIVETLKFALKYFEEINVL